MLFPFESSTCWNPSLPVVVCRCKALATHHQRRSVAGGDGLSVAALRHGDAGQLRKLLHQLVALVLNRAAILAGGRCSCESCPFSCAICGVSELICATVCVTCSSASDCARGEPVGRGVEGAGQILAGGDHALLGRGASGIRGQLREAA